MLKTVQWNVKFGMNYFFWLHFRFITAIDCALSLAVISTANLQWDLQHSQKLYSVQPKYLQCTLGPQQGVFLHRCRIFLINKAYLATFITNLTWFDKVCDATWIYWQQQMTLDGQTWSLKYWWRFYMQIIKDDKRESCRLFLL